MIFNINPFPLGMHIISCALYFVMGFASFFFFMTMSFVSTNEEGVQGAGIEYRAEVKFH
jgi:hypothetical protein